jgi:hypothetical protein
MDENHKKFIGMYIWESDNNGHISIFPDQIELHGELEDKFIDTLLHEFKIKYGKDSVIYIKSQNNPNYTKVN